MPETGVPLVDLYGLRKIGEQEKNQPKESSEKEE